ncbi:hypothetical protein [Blastococcus brunescens]|uniref:Uncharacterized protein n=1 Tax=Blastococcus brunescens TaxID=1564165 RepID=A0ABZ1B2D2_9ACTN|nr:hypothetical protein [Blastococcus sp. BMG 8361]WRL64311.1 hypothetical protein U6N30_00110 [Blastococcus sp. BMG 8361]
MPMYRVLAGPDDVIYVFSADDDAQAERIARQISTPGRPPDPEAEDTRFVSVEGLVEEHWRRVSAWIPH